jgi:hypothetical protein
LPERPANQPALNQNIENNPMQSSGRHRNGRFARENFLTRRAISGTIPPSPALISQLVF